MVLCTYISVPFMLHAVLNVHLLMPIQCIDVLYLDVFLLFIHYVVNTPCFFVEGL